jgi:IS30 family transposase
MKHYQHLGNEERFYIWQARQTGHTQQHISKALDRHPTTVCRELNRNTYARCQMYTYY